MSAIGLENVKGGQHLLAAYEDIRQAGIREARRMHTCRLKRCRALRNLQMFAATIYPAQSISEALEDAKAAVREWRRMPTWRQQRRYTRMIETKELIVVLRYFRRFGAAIWAAREAA